MERECFGGKGDLQELEGLILIGHILRYCARMFLVYFHATPQPQIYYFFLTEVHRATATYLKVIYLKNVKA